MGVAGGGGGGLAWPALPRYLPFFAAVNVSSHKRENFKQSHHSAGASCLDPPLQGSDQKALLVALRSPAPAPPSEGETEDDAGEAPRPRHILPKAAPGPTTRLILRNQPTAGVQPCFFPPSREGLPPPGGRGLSGVVVLLVFG